MHPLILFNTSVQVLRIYT